MKKEEQGGEKGQLFGHATVYMGPHRLELVKVLLDHGLL